MPCYDAYHLNSEHLLFLKVFRAQASDLAHFFGDWSQNEKLVEISPFLKMVNFTAKNKLLVYISAILCSVGIIPICCRLLGADLQYFTHENAFSQVNAVARFWPQFSAKLWNDAQPEK